MLREFVKLNYDIFNYATRQVADYLTVKRWETRELVVELNQESRLRSLFDGFLIDMRSALRRSVISESEINAISELFKKEYLDFIKNNQRVISSTFFRYRQSIPGEAYPITSSSLREQKLCQYFNDLRFDLTDYQVTYASGSRVRDSSAKATMVDESSITVRIDAFVSAIKEIYGISTSIIQNERV